MADYRDLAAALGAGYGQDTGPITADTLQTLKSGYRSPNFLRMLADIGRGSLSNLESLVRGGAAQVPGTAGDIEALARMGLNKSFGAGGVNVNPETALPTTADIMKMLPQRMTQVRPETAGMEELGTVIGPGLGKAVKPLAKAYANLALEDIAMASTGQPTRSLLGDITPKPLMIVESSNRTFKAPQETALALAQQRAALPKDQNGLGLPANNTPEMRYQAMKGVEGNFVHGSKNPDIEKFKTRKQIFEESANDPNRAIAENHYANERNAVFASSDPEFTTAFSQHGYTDVGQAPTSYLLRMIGGNKVFDFENPSHLDLLKQKYAEMFPVKTIGREGYVPSEESIRMHTINKRIENLPNDTNNWPAIESQDFQKAIRELGFDAFHVNERGTKNIGVYDPSSLRSPFAAYDPFRKDVATATAMGVALPDLLAAEKENKQKKLSKALAK